MTSINDREPEPSYPLAPKKKKLPYILFAVVFIGYFLMVILSPLDFHWLEFVLIAIFGGGIVAILAGARPPGWRKDSQGRNL